MDALADLFDAAQQWLFQALVQPALFGLGMGGLLEDGYAATGWLLVGLLQIAAMLAVIAPLQRWRPVEPVVDRRTIRVDMLYTFIHRLGLFRVALFLLLGPVFNALFGTLRVAGVHPIQIDALWPGVTDLPWASLLLYLLAFDFTGYWIHRGQHAWRWWWSLHALHHSQRQVTMWSDNRNHLLDDVVRACIVVCVAQLIGVAPGQFIAIVAFTQLSESLQHANLRLWFGRVGERLWISPRFHRRHHGIAAGRAGCNFGVLLPWWDMLFGTADFALRYEPTGVRDQVEPGPTGHPRDYGRGFWAQQWLGLRRLAGRG
ncbi:sterol desaturase family protein [Ramlibacter sp. H39-3-26]|uniref:sterol desaturase family protein n=1 Tax=Curvibacter soli TaxID=3031331 RepID=UPI0023DA21AC|nr:sterol desaturase family protein [Ramlibacter sp. H39-3-26]MDF1485974.1 sterol desaturase family protein [Ramlibacter sp. H39-3-26]